MLTRPGFREVQVKEDTHVFRHADLAAYWRGARGSGMRRSIDALDAQQTERVRLAACQQADGYRIPATALLAAATR